MIEFNGYISGAAEKRFFKKSRDLGQNLMLASVLIFLPTVIQSGIRMRSWLLIGLYCSLFVIIPLLARIPKSQTEKKAILPKRIFTEGESIVCIAEKYAETRLISDAKLVRDFGEFYEIVFPFGKISDKFICQKSLLIKGSLEEFESLFEGKIKNNK